MNRIALLLASLTLMSCTKPWMVGSLNDRIRPAEVPGGVWTRDFVPGGNNAPAYDNATVLDEPKYRGRAHRGE